MFYKMRDMLEWRYAISYTEEGGLQMVIICQNTPGGIGCVVMEIRYHAMSRESRIEN